MPDAQPATPAPSSTGSLFDGLAPAAGSPSGASADPAPAVAKTAPPPPEPSAEDWKAAGFEAPWLQKFAGGKFKKEADAVRGYDEFGKLVNTHAEEAKSAQAKAAELAQRLAAVEPIIGAPVDEKGEPKPYEFGWTDPESIAPELSSRLESLLRKHNLSETVAKDLVPLAEDYAAAMTLGNREAEMAGAMKFYGIADAEIEAALEDPSKFSDTKAGQDTLVKMKALQTFWEEKLADNPALTDAMRRVAHRFDGIEFLEGLRSELSSIKNGATGYGAGPESADSILKAAANDSSYFLRNPDAYQRLHDARAREAAGK